MITRKRFKKSEKETPKEEEDHQYELLNDLLTKEQLENLPKLNENPYTKMFPYLKDYMNNKEITKTSRKCRNLDTDKISSLIKDIKHIHQKRVYYNLQQQNTLLQIENTKQELSHFVTNKT